MVVLTNSKYAVRLGCFGNVAEVYIGLEPYLEAFVRIVNCSVRIVAI